MAEEGQQDQNRFNGATPQQAWKVEAQRLHFQNQFASMGPRLNRRGKVGRLPSAQIISSSFNGATPQQAWKASVDPPELIRFVMLQWGHASTGVESQLSP